MAISSEPRKVSQIRWCQNDQETNLKKKMFLFIFQNKMSPRLPVIYIYHPVSWESQEINQMKDLGRSQKTFTSERFYDSERIFIKNQIKDLFNKKESIKTRKGQIAPLSFGSTSSSQCYLCPNFVFMKRRQYRFSTKKLFQVQTS